MKRRDLEKHLRRNGCRFHHAGGRHDIWVNPSTGDQEAIPRHSEINDFTARSLCEGLNVPRPKR